MQGLKLVHHTKVQIVIQPCLLREFSQDFIVVLQKICIRKGDSKNRLSDRLPEMRPFLFLPLVQSSCSFGIFLFVSSQPFGRFDSSFSSQQLFASDFLISLHTSVIYVDINCSIAEFESCLACTPQPRWQRRAYTLLLRGGRRGFDPRQLCSTKCASFPSLAIWKLAQSLSYVDFK